MLTCCVSCSILETNLWTPTFLFTTIFLCTVMFIPGKSFVAYAEELPCFGHG